MNKKKKLTRRTASPTQGAGFPICCILSCQTQPNNSDAPADLAVGETMGSQTRATKSRTKGRQGRATLSIVVAVLLALALPALAGDSTRTLGHNYDTPVPGSYTSPVIKAAADGALLDSSGRPVGLAELTRGRIAVMSFIYTRCAAAKACPMATGVLLQLHRESAGDAAMATRLRLVSMSFDPANDTPERMAAYSGLASSRTNASPWHFVTAKSQAELQPILAAYGQAVDKKQNPNDPTGPLNHTLRVFLMDRGGNIRKIYSSGTLDLRLVLADIRTLMMEEGKP